MIEDPKPTQTDDSPDEEGVHQRRDLDEAATETATSTTETADSSGPDPARSAEVVEQVVTPPPAAEPPAAEPPAAEPPAAEPPDREKAKPVKLAGRPKAPDSDDFGRLLAKTGFDRPIEQGTIVKGKIVAFSDAWAFVDLSAKTEGILALDELKNDDGELSYGIGDAIEAFVVSTRGGETRLSFALGRQIRDFDALADAYDNRIPVEGRVESTNKGGFDVIVGGRRAFCPISQIDLAYTEDPSVHLGKTYEFRIIELARKGKRIVVSRAALLREERAEQQEALRDELYEGAILEGVVTSIQDYGAFVDLGGLEGLVHVSELSWARVEHPSEVVKERDEVTVKVLDVKQTDKGERISLSMRQTAPHPWIAVGTKFVEGETYPGTVTRLEPYGAFVELGPGIEGLVHISELSWERRINHPGEILEVGQEINVYLKSIDEDRQRIALSVKALQQDPWETVGDRYAPGSLVSGTIERIQPFGLFVEVEPGLVALIPASESGTGTGTDLRREFHPGQSVSATVLSVEPSRKRMSLSLKASGEARDEKEVQRFMKDQKEATQKGGFGTLGDLFGDKFK